MSEALQTIASEHRSMWQVSVVLEELCKQYGDPDEKPDAELFELILEYIEQYIERVHQPKEEAYLYRAVAERTAEGAELIEQFRREHAASPEIVARLRTQLHELMKHFPTGREQFRADLEAYISLLRTHIKREESD